MTRLFEGTLGLTASTGVFGWTPAVDIFEDTEGVTLKFDLPEVDPKDVDVRLEDGVLTVRGQRKLEREDRREGYHRMERSYGVFARSFTLPATLHGEKATAEGRTACWCLRPQAGRGEAEEHQRQGELVPAATRRALLRRSRPPRPARAAVGAVVFSLGRVRSSASRAGGRTRPRCGRPPVASRTCR